MSDTLLMGRENMSMLTNHFIRQTPTGITTNILESLKKYEILYFIYL